MGAVHAKSFQKDEPFNSMPTFENSFSNDISSKVLNDQDDASNVSRFHQENIEPTKVENKASSKNLEVKVDVVHVDGLKRTKDDIFARLLKELFKARDMGEVILKVDDVRQRLVEMDAFDSIGILIDTSKGPKATPNGLDVSINVVEKNLIKATLSTTIDNNDGSVVFNAKMPNVFGRGEQFQCEHQRGRKSSGLHVGYIKPLFTWGNLRMGSQLFQQGADTFWSGYKSLEKGIASELTFNSAPSISHTLKWEGVWRELSCLSPNTSFSIREDIGHSFKSALKHILKIDNRKGLTFPESGSYLKLSQEFAGLGGNVNMVKHELEYQTNYSLLPQILLQGTFAAGILKGWGNGYYNVCDKFYLGGPLSLRGFDMGGVGPRDQDDALGAESYWAAGLHLYTPLPFISTDSGLGSLLRAHLFFNSGNIGNFTLSEDYHNYLKSLLNNLRCSYGVGLALSMNNMARVELNYVVPIMAQETDKVKPGLQFGFGVSFL